MYCQSCGADNPAEHSTCFACHHALDASTVADASTPLLNQRYRLLTQVGAGGFGAVYKAKDTQAAENRPALVAIKQTNLRGLTPQEAIEATDTFHREVALLSHLKHANLPRIYEHFTDPDHWYLVMDFIEGETLEDYLHQGSIGNTGTHSLPLDEVCRIGLQLCEVLHYLHTRQPAIIFRDLKPTNIMRTPKGHLFLIDFGIARHFKPGQTRDTIPLGSPGYAAPEQYGKQQTTPQSDLYSLGALLHQLLSGEDPAENAFHFTPLRLYGDERVIALEALVTDLVDIDARKRPESATQVKQELQRISEVGHQARIWHPPVPQDLPQWQPTFSQQQMQQMQQQAPKPKATTSRRTALKVTTGLLAGIALVGGIEALAAFSHPKTISYPAPSSTAAVQVHPTQWTQRVYYGHTAPVSSLAWSPDSKLIASADYSSIQVWQTSEGNCIYRQDAEQVLMGGWPPDGRLLASAFITDGKTTVLGVPLPGQRGKGFMYTLNLDAAQALAWSPDGKRIAIGISQDVHVLDVATGEIVFTQGGQNDAGHSLTWSPDGRYLAWYSSLYNKLEVWNVVAQSRIFSHQSVVPNEIGSGGTVVWSPDGKFLAFTPQEAIEIWSTTSWQVTSTIGRNGIITIALAWSPDSKRLVSAGDSDGTVWVWNVTDGSPLFSYQGHTATVEAVAWSPDGSSVASAGVDKTVQIWAPHSI
ncbi:MAG TPA: serine/threonine-protein kinase [Ktedonosporobacter sp.]|nr:serine/threonine-protein kinase [Ktedonosporobacter sp.]